MSDNDRTLLGLAQGYAADTLSPEAARTFEDRLADDQNARDALSRAVGRLHPDARPDPGYRQAVRRRLRPRGWQRLFTPRPYRGHPSLWALAGAALVLVAVLCWPTQPPRTIEHPVAAVPPRVAPVPEKTTLAHVTPTPAPAKAAEETPHGARPLDSQVVRGTHETRPLVAPMGNP
jgi:alkylation response protein AidB-like acyl-CoA dehydrogenase